jgi:O-antigen/teichoic acid export membrane protein
VYLVASLASVTALGIYGVAVSGAEAMLTVTAVTEIFSRSRVRSLPREQAASLTATCLRDNLVLWSVTCAVAIFAAPYAVTLLYGPAFAGAIRPLQILLVGIVAVSLVSVLTNYYTVATGKTKVPFLMQATSTISCAAISMWLIPTMGITGAAIATTSSYLLTISSALIWFAYESRLPMHSVIFAGKADLDGFLAASVQLWTKEKALKHL